MCITMLPTLGLVMEELDIAFVPREIINLFMSICFDVFLRDRRYFP